MAVSVVVTCWNGKKLLEKNLPSVIEAALNPINKIGEILVVDDGSTDDSTDFVRKFNISNFKFQIRLIAHDKNYGYSKTCNTGVTEAKGELVVILNLDVIPTKNFLEFALAHFEDNKVFSVSFNEGKFGPGKLVWKKGFLEIESTSFPKSTTESDWPSGGSSIFKKDYWLKLGGMNGLFLPFYFEDIDLGIRAGKAGYRCLWEPKSKVDHKHEGTINSDSFKLKYINSIKERNHLLLIWLNLTSLNLFFQHLTSLFKRIIQSPGYLKIVFLAIFRLIFYTLKCKKKI